MIKTWEDNISLRNKDPYAPKNIGYISDYISQDDGSVDYKSLGIDAREMATRDTAPLPSCVDREGYYGENHFNYWASGLCDMVLMQEWLKKKGRSLNSYLDIGCASGRVTRHFAAQDPDVSVFGCDINRQHVDWCNAFLPKKVVTFQNTSVPQLPLPDESIDLVSAFSVFTHIETFDTAWLMELRRILKPGGTAWLTIHGDRTWSEITPNWPLHNALTTHPDYAQYAGKEVIPEDRMVFRWQSDTSYSANVFYSYEYIKTQWGRILDIDDIFPGMPIFQDVVVLTKR